MPPTRAISTKQRFGAISVLLSLFHVLYRLVRTHKTDAVDVAITSAFQQKQHPRLFRLMHDVSWLGFPPQSRIVPWLLPILWALSGRWIEAVIQMMGWGTGILSGLFKHRMKRPRPDKERFYYAPARIGGTSFPSGHVINYLGVYGTAAYLAAFNIRSRPLRRVCLCLIGGLLALVGPSRVYLGHHWASDVTASYLLGSSYVLGLGGVYGFLKEREQGLLERHAQVTDPHTFEIVGHGGAGAFHPGNSRNALLAGMLFDIDRIEFDLRQAGDGELILLHDEEIETKPGILTPIDQVSTDTLRTIFPGLLTFREAIDLIDGRFPIMIDLKLGGFEPELITAINDLGIAETACISCTDPRAIRKLRSAFPHMIIGLSTGYRPLGGLIHLGKPVTTGILQDFAPFPLLAAMRWCGASAVMLHHFLVAPDVVQLFQEHDYPVYAWTIDHPTAMKHAVASRVDGIISNRPDLVVDLVRPVRGASSR